MGNANNMPKKKPAAKKTPARKPPGKKQPGIPRAASAAPKAMGQPIAHVFPGPDKDTAIVCSVDPAGNYFDCHPVPVSQLSLIIPRR